MNRAEINELERVQYATEHATKILFLDVAQRQVEMEATIVPEDMDPVENETLEEAMLQSIIEVSLVKAKDEIIEIDNGIAPIRQRPMSDVDE